MKMKTLQKHTTISIMNWRGKIGLIVFFFAALLAACEAPKEIGLAPDAPLEIKYIDTFTVKASTVLLDSVRTSSSAQMLVGNVLDPQFGKISARSFFEYGNVINLNPDKIYQYDSVSISMSYSYVYGDTIQPFKLNIHRLVDTLQNKTYYNNNAIAYEPKPFATTTFTPTFSQSSFMRLQLPEAYGRQIFGSSGTFKTVQEFVKYFKGFAFIPDPNNKAVLGFSSGGIQVELFFHENGAVGSILLPIRLSRRFNQVLAQRIDGSALSKLTQLKPVPTQQTNGLSYVQSALGVVTKIEFPYLASLLKSKQIAINRAELLIKPELTTTLDGYFPIPSTVVMAETDETNRVLRSKGGLELLLPEDGQTFNSTINPQIVGYNARTQGYNFVLSTYFQALTSGFKKTNGLLLMPLNFAQWSAYAGAAGGNPSNFTPFLNTNIDRMTLRPNASNTKLVLFYTTTK